MWKQKTLLITVVTLATAIIGAVAGRHYSDWIARPALAQDAISLPASSSAKEPEIIFHAPESAGTLALTDQASSEISEQAADFKALLALNTKAVEKFLKPGWIHFTYQVVSENVAGSNGTLGNGVDIPVNYTSESWYHLNDKGLVFESVSLMISDDGRVVQIGTFRDGVGRNLTTNEEFNGEPFVLNLDFGFARDAQESKQEGRQVLQRSTLLEGKDTLLFTISDKYSTPKKIVGYEQLVVSTEQRAYFDPGTGQLIQLSTTVKLADGTEQVGSSVKSVMVESVDTLPDTVVNYLKQEIVK